MKKFYKISCKLKFNYKICCKYQMTKQARFWHVAAHFRNLKL